MTRTELRDDSVLGRFERQAAIQPDAVAAIFESQEITYRQLDHAARRLAQRLRRLGVAPDTIVGIAVERSLEMVIGVLGVLAAGGAYLPLDPTHPGDRLQFMLDDSRTDLVLTQARFHRQPALSGRTALVLDADGLDPDGEAEAPAMHAASQDLAYVIYTSGSTGRPKGVMIERGSFDNQILWMADRYPLTPGHRVAQLAALTFDFSVIELFWPLVAGAAIVLPRPGGEKDPEYLAALLRDREVTDVHFVPSMLDVYLAHPGLPGLPSLRRLFSGGEVLTPALVRRCRAAFPGVELHNQYGPTETTINATHWECVGNDSPVPIGTAVGGTTVHVLDQQMQPTAAGAVGELFIGGVQVARGYLGRTALTAERFVADPFAAGAGSRLFRTGDLAYVREDGAICFVGRVDHQVKLRGLRIELGEIEVVLAQAPGVRHAVVIVHRPNAEQPGQLIAFVVPDERAAIDTAALRGHAARYLPDYMIPARIIRLDTLPLGANGKLDRNALSAWASAEPPAHAAPEATVEQVLCAIAAQLAGRTAIDPAHNLLEQGLDSLTIVRFAVQVRQVFQVAIPVRFLRMPIIREIERFIADRRLTA